MYIFETERLGFRMWKDDDRDIFADMNSNDQVMRFFPKKLSRDESDSMIDRIVSNIDKNGYGLWAVEIKTTGEFIGFIGFAQASFEAEFTPCLEIGWRLHWKYWNKGYATEGAKACLNYGFTNLGFKDIYSFTSETNKPSQNVMKKIGMYQEGTFEHPKVDVGNELRPHVLYRITDINTP